MERIVKHKIFIKKDTGERVIITSVVDYPGNKSVKICFTKGYGASEERLEEIIPEKLLDKWLDNLQDPNKEEVKKATKLMAKTENTMESLQQVLCQTIDKVIDGTLTTDQGKTVSQLAQTLINTAKVEIEYRKTITSKEVPFIGK